MELRSKSFFHSVYKLNYPLYFRGAIIGPTVDQLDYIIAVVKKKKKKNNDILIGIRFRLFGSPVQYNVITLVRDMIFRRLEHLNNNSAADIRPFFIRTIFSTFSTFPFVFPVSIKNYSAKSKVIIHMRLYVRI